MQQRFLLQILLLAQNVSGITMPSILQTGRITLSSTPDQLLEKPQHEIPQAATTV
jgi:hypothetical protein